MNAQTLPRFRFPVKLEKIPCLPVNVYATNTLDDHKISSNVLKGTGEYLSSLHAYIRSVMS